jgi:DNA-binding GntR family transcriptional regulator
MGSMPETNMPGATPSIRQVPRTARSLSHHVAAGLRAAIVDGSLAPGERIVEEDLARQMEISRGPVREGLRQLESEGLVESFPNRRTVVADMSLQEVQKVLLPMRSLIERYAVETVLPHLVDEDFAHLQNLVNEMAAAARAPDLPLLVDLDVRFHQYLVERSGHQHSARLWEQIAPRIRHLFFRMGPRHTDLSAIAEQHAALLALLVTQDRDRVLEALDEHIADRALFAGTHAA